MIAFNCPRKSKVVDGTSCVRKTTTRSSVGSTQNAVEARLENPQKVSANLLRRDDVQRIDLDGRALLVLQVPKAPRSQRPVHLNGSWENKTYLRVHEGDRIASREVARRMLADAQPDHDAQVLEGYAEADFHAESVRQYRQLLASRRPDHPFLREDDAGFLWQIGALGRDRLRKTEGVTLGGLMMLGREDAIRDRFPHWHLSYRELPADTAAGPRWLDPRKGRPAVPPSGVGRPGRSNWRPSSPSAPITGAPCPRSP